MAGQRFLIPLIKVRVLVPERKIYGPAIPSGSTNEKEYQMPPYTEGVPFVPGSATSQRAARAARVNAPTQRARVKNFLVTTGRVGATRNELTTATGIQNKSLCPRIRELLEAGEIVTLKETRKTPAQNDAVILVCAEFVDGREIDPFVKYILVALDAFNEVFREFDAEWRLERWIKIQTLASTIKE